MDHTEKLTRYTANFVDELIHNGIQDVVISPGSRSTPLALTFSEHEGVKEWIVIDERSAAFFALGIAKQTNKPVALVCTSGTAAANYFPAIVEAHYSRVPLVVITADRPHELRDVGAPQAIEQIKIYGDYVKWFVDMALPDATPEMLKYVRNKAKRAVYMAIAGNPAPVHINMPFREPLAPDFSLENIWGHRDSGFPVNRFDGEKQLSEKEITLLLEKLTDKKRGLIVCGPQIDNDAFPKAVTDLAHKWNIPILADPLSQIRFGSHQKGNIIETYDAILKDEAVRKAYKPEFIIRFGAMPVSKSYLFYLKENQDIPQFVVENSTGFREPTGNATEFIFADSVILCEALILMEAPSFSANWLHRWQQMNEIAKKHLLQEPEVKVTEGEAVRGLAKVIPNESVLYVGNSMAVRDVDTFFLANEKQIHVLANRGANGIDGMVSSAVGAAIDGETVTLVLGDLSFFHDMNGLQAAKHYRPNMTILLINNDGGGIFSFLPQANDKKHFEALFGTPVGLDFNQVATLYEATYEEPKTQAELEIALKASYEHQGLSIVEVKTDREENVNWHRSIWGQITQDIIESKE